MSFIDAAASWLAGWLDGESSQALLAHTISVSSAPLPAIWQGKNYYYYHNKLLKMRYLKREPAFKRVIFSCNIFFLYENVSNLKPIDLDEDYSGKNLIKTKCRFLFSMSSATSSRHCHCIISGEQRFSFFFFLSPK